MSRFVFIVKYGISEALWIVNTYNLNKKQRLKELIPNVTLGTILPYNAFSITNFLKSLLIRSSVTIPLLDCYSSFICLVTV